MTENSIPARENSQSDFKQQFLRIRQITGASTRAEIAAFFNTTLYAVKTACRKRKIPAEWLLFLVMWKGVNPEWVLRGVGSCFFARCEQGDESGGRYETGEDRQPRQQEREALAKISSPALADELLRRLRY